MGNRKDILFAFAKEMSKKLPLSKREEFLPKFQRYAILYQKAKENPSDGAMAWERNYVGSQLKFELHAALTGDMDSARGVIAFGSGNGAYIPMNQKEKDYLKKRHRELFHIASVLNTYAQAPGSVQEKFDVSIMQNYIIYAIMRRKPIPHSFCRMRGD